MTTSRIEYRLRPRQILLAILIALFTLGPILSDTSAQEVPELGINSQAYIVIDADTGEIFAQKNAHDHRAMASLTKVFTAIEAIKRAPLNMEITTAEDDVFSDSSTRVGFGAGETFTLTDLIYGMLLPSGNDAAHAIARSLGTEPGDTGDQGYERFISWMNERIKMMGLTDTNLVNPHGWGVPNHYSTAYDLAVFTMYAIQEPAFLDAISTSSYSTENGYSFTNTNKLLNSYSSLIGGKTGYDDDAGYCLIEVASRDGHTMISVTLDGVAPDDWYDDNRVLLEYAFDQVAARDGTIEGEVASYTSPDVAMLSSAASTGVIQGRQLDASAAVVPTAAVPDNQATGDAKQPDQSDSQIDVALGTASGVPGFGTALLVALLVLAAFAVLAGREVRQSGASLGAMVRSRYQRLETGKTDGLRARVGRLRDRTPANE